MQHLEQNLAQNIGQFGQGSLAKSAVVIRDCASVREGLERFCANAKNAGSKNNENSANSENNGNSANPKNPLSPNDLDFRAQNIRFFIKKENPSDLPKPPPLSSSLSPKSSFGDVLRFLDSLPKSSLPKTLQSDPQNPQIYETKRELSQTELDALLDSALYECPYFSISQVCDLRVFVRDLEPLFRLDIDSHKVDICFDEAFCVVEDRGFIEDLYEQVESALFAQNVILHRNEIRANLSLILESIAKNPAKKKEIFCLQKAKIYEPSKQADFVFLPQKAWEASNGKAPQNAAFGVRDGEQIAVLYKSHLGKAGRTLFGDFALPQNVESKKLITTRQEGIDTHDTPTSIIYTAKKDGFLQVQNGEFRFVAIPRNAFSTRNVPPLLGGAHLDIQIACADMAEDAIGSGVWCEVGNLKVRGCVAENTRIKAKTLIIEGSTHKSAHIKAYAAQIRTHKGKLECTHCAIENLDNGELIAHSAKILRANGAKIATDNATIYELKSNNKIFFAKNCAIKSNKGGQNELIFCASAGGGFAKWSKSAKEFFATQNAVLKKLGALADFWANKQGRASEFLEKMKGFSEYQKQIALKDEAYAARYREALAQANVAQILQAKIAELQKQILEVKNNALSSLKNALLKANLTIQEKWGYDNYAILLKPNMSVFESSLDFGTNAKSNQTPSQNPNNAKSNPKSSIDSSFGFFGDVGLDREFERVFGSAFGGADDTLDKLELQEGASGQIAIDTSDNNFKLKVVQ